MYLEVIASSENTPPANYVITTHIGMAPNGTPTGNVGSDSGPVDLLLSNGRVWTIYNPVLNSGTQVMTAYIVDNLRATGASGNLTVSAGGTSAAPTFVRLAGSVSATNTATITMLSSGAILSDTTTQTLTARNITLNATAGKIGIAERPVRIDLQGGSLTANSYLDVRVTEINGELRIASAASSAGSLWFAGPSIVASSATLSAAGSVTGTSTAGSITLGPDTHVTATTGAITFTPSAGAALTVGPRSTLTAGTGITLPATGAFVSTDSTWTAGADIGVTGTSINVNRTTITAAGSVTGTATTGAVTLGPDTRVTATAGAITITPGAGQTLTIGIGSRLAAGTNITLPTTGALTSNDSTLTAGGNITMTGTSILASSTVLTAAGSVTGTSTAGSITLGPDTHVTATTGAITFTPSAGAALTVGPRSTLTAGTGITLPATGAFVSTDSTWTAGANINVTGTSINVSRTAITAAGSIAGTATAGPVTLTTSTLTAGGCIVVTATAGPITLTDSTLHADGCINLTASGALTSTDSTLTAGTFITMTAASVASTDTLVSAATTVTVTTTAGIASTDSTWTAVSGDLTFTGGAGNVTMTRTPVTSGRDITVTGRDITSTDSRLGAARSIALTGTGTGALTRSALAATTGSIVLSLTGALTSTDSTLTAGTFITMTAGGAIASTDSTWTAGTFVQGSALGSVLMSTNAKVTALDGEITFSAGDDLTVVPTAVLTATTAITLGVDTPDTDSGTGSAMLLEGTFDAPLMEIYGGPDDDSITLRPVEITGLTRIFGGAADDSIWCDRMPTLEYPVEIDGEGGSDTIVIDTTGDSDYLIVIHDTGASIDGFDVTEFLGTSSEDFFLVRSGFVANMQSIGDPFDLEFESTYERVDYDGTLEQLYINGRDGVDCFFADDTSTSVTMEGSTGNDTFQFGQLYGAERVSPDHVAVGDEESTVGTTDGFLTRGVSHSSIAFGGEGEDSFTIYSNKARLELQGQNGDDSFVIRSFLIDRTDGITEYVTKGTLVIDAGSGVDRMSFIGSNAVSDDNVAMDADDFWGMGVNLTYVGTEWIEVDARDGDDSFFVLGTAPTVMTTLIGGGGTDTFNVGGDVTARVIGTYVLGGPDQPVVTFAAQPQTTALFEGPLIIEGDSIRTYGFASAAMLPTETDVALPTPPTSIETSTATDFLNVYNAGSLTNDSGSIGLVSEFATPAVSALLCTGTAPFDRAMFGNVSGLNMGSTFAFNFGTSAAPDVRSLDGGVTYHGLEIVDVLMGQGDDTFTVHDTIPAVITLIQGGGGSDTIQVTEGGGNESPLIIFGDTSQDGTFYNSTAAAYDAYAAGGYAAPSTLRAREFTNPGDDVLIADQIGTFVAMYGGAGSDAIYGVQTSGHYAGGSGDDYIVGGEGDDHLYGDSGFNVDLSVRLGLNPQILLVTNAVGVGDYVTTRDTMTSGDDTILGLEGNDIVFGDRGRIDQAPGTQRIFTTDVVISAQAVNPGPGGGNDLIFGGEGNDILLGGDGDDVIAAADGNDLVFGDYGMVVGDIIYDALPLVPPVTPFTFVSVDTTHSGGGNDYILGDAGDDLLMGQFGDDTIYGGAGDDDIWGGHNIAGGFDGDDTLDGADGVDVIVGDNAIILRRGDSMSLRLRTVTREAIYDLADDVVLGNDLGLRDPTGWHARDIVPLDHSAYATPGTWGDDAIAGGAGDDYLFGQLGNDVIQGDGSVDLGAGAMRDADGLLVVTPSMEAATDGDDYIEAGGDDDVVFGGLGQDDIIGGSSSLFGLSAATSRPDGNDIIFGGAGTRIDRNYALSDANRGGIVILDRHAADADTIVGDNGNIYRLVSLDATTGATVYLSFAYDVTMEDMATPEIRGSLRIIPRAVELLDYTPGGPDFAPTSGDVGGADEAHGEAGDDTIYGMCRNDVLYGDSEDDDIIGGWGHDWISGGTGDDGVLGDDGRIWTSRNGLPEPLYGLSDDLEGGFDRRISAADGVRNYSGEGVQSVTINVLGELRKTVNMTPFNLDPSVVQDESFRPAHADDIIYGGLGNDWLHGGAGDDAISGSEAMAFHFGRPMNLGDALGYDAETGKFAAWDSTDPWGRLFVNAQGDVDPDSDIPFLLTFDPADGGVEISAYGWGVTFVDGHDRIFGDNGNDWLVGGPGEDRLYGGWGDDLLNTGDLESGTFSNNQGYADIAFGGEGDDVLVSGDYGDRLVDGAVDTNSYVAPSQVCAVVMKPFDVPFRTFLLALSRSDGADPTRAGDTAGPASRNGEPQAELSLTWTDPTNVVFIPPTVLLTLEADLGAPVGPRSLSRNRVGVFRGILRPWHPFGSEHVRVYFERLVGGRWRVYGSVQAGAADYSTFTMYRALVKLPYSGRWRFRAHHGDSGHGDTWSNYWYVVVR